MTTRNRESWIVIGLVSLALVPVLAGMVRVGKISSGDLALENARFLSSPLVIVTHIFTAAIYSLLGAFQFSPGVRRRWPRWHRVSGTFLIPLAVLVAVTGLSMTVYFPQANLDGTAVFVSRLIVGASMLAFIALGITALARRDFEEHGSWMMRSYALAMGAGTQVLTHMPLFLVPSLHTEMGRAVAMIGAWGINFAVAEWLIWKNRRRRNQMVREELNMKMQKAGSSPAFQALG